MDIETRKNLDEFLMRAQGLLDNVEIWARPAGIESVREEIDVNEEAAGSYKTWKLILKASQGEVIAQIVPIGAWIIGANGRVDIKGKFDDAIVVHLNEGGPRITTTIKDGDKVSSKTKTLYKGISEEGWYLIDRRTSKGRKLDKESFLETLNELSDYEPE